MCEGVWRFTGLRVSCASRSGDSEMSQAQSKRLSETLTGTVGLCGPADRIAAQGPWWLLNAGRHGAD